jgi:hypothetical protein
MNFDLQPDNNRNSDNYENNQGGEDNDDFDYVDDGQNQDMNGKPGGGLGDALGLDDHDEFNEEEHELMNDDFEEEPQEKPTPIDIFICFDEDDDNEHGIDLGKEMGHVGKDKPFKVEVRIIMIASYI